ncbi:hypothetical protein CTI12_AA588380 [Artemisia annua]|uniref:Uncharacterized protein n=1 Tax=Artemisia annua TaxID=35608 RepID=A0A2U1KLS2_ARTAN|nr:hypothetical protein CTI12_AA588380 [Artemisia annua]
MASVNPFVAPNSGDTPWVDQIRKTLKTQLAVKVDTPPVSIFNVPKNLKEEKLEAYVPQRIGLGPKHFFQAELYSKMEQNKLIAVKKVLKPHETPDLEDQVVEQVKKIVPIVSACYDAIDPQIDEDTLAWLFAIDGLFLLDQLGIYSDKQVVVDAKDMMMLENQVPLLVLKEIQKVLANEEHGEEIWGSRLQLFCKTHSPLVIARESVDFSKVNHLLDYMYNCIVNNEGSGSNEISFRAPGSVPDEVEATEELLDAIIKAAELYPAAKPFLQILESVKKILYESDDDKTSIQEIRVPSVTELTNIAKVKFVLSPSTEGIRSVSFVDGSCYLPAIKLNFDSEVILRNLMAYEKLMAKNSFYAGFGLELTEYVDFMCGVIDSAKDVKLLREAKIIEGSLSDEEIVDLFNGIGRSLGKMSSESVYRKTVAALNKVYGDIPSVKFLRETEKQVRASAKAITFLVSISGTLALIREVYLKTSPDTVLVNLFSQFGSLSSLIQ